VKTIFRNLILIGLSYNKAVVKHSPRNKIGSIFAVILEVPMLVTCMLSRLFVVVTITVDRIVIAVIIFACMLIPQFRVKTNGHNNTPFFGLSRGVMVIKNMTIAFPSFASVIIFSTNDGNFTIARSQHYVFFAVLLL
jgi:hypothetical protein